MRKSLAVFALAAMTGSLAVPAVADSRVRTETREYNAMTANAAGAGGTLGQVTFPTRNGERWVRIDVTDASGQDIAFDVDQGADRSVEVDGCGSSERIRIAGGRPVTVSILVHVSEDSSCPMPTGTQGAVQAQFGRS